MIDIQAIARGDRADSVQLLCGDLTRQQSNDMPRLALAAYPRGVLRLAHWGEAHLLIHLVAGEQHFFQHAGSFGIAGDFHQNAKRQGVVNHRLANVEDIGAALRQHAGDGRG